MAESEQAAVQLEQLTLSDTKQEESPAESTSAEVAEESAPVEAQEPADTYQPTPEDHESVDLAIRQALADSRERQTVLTLEAQVAAFIEDPTQEQLEFPPSLTNYQRMLAHRIGQHFGLSTMSQEYNPHGGPGRVLARKDKRSPPKTVQYKFADLDVSNLQGRTYSRPNSALGDAPKVMMKRPGMDGHYGHRPGPPDMMSSDAGHMPAKSAQEKEQEYYQARERLLGKGPAFDAAGPGANGRGRGRFGPHPGRSPAGFAPFNNGMGPPAGGRGPFPGAPLPAEDMGRGRKALYKDKTKDHEDPDYRRGVNRYPGMGYDPSYQPQPAGGVYNMPAYGAEFPALHHGGSTASNASARSYQADSSYSNWASGSPSYRPGSAPQPPPPPGAGQPLPGTPTQKPGAMQPASPAQHGMQMAARPMAGYAMAPYPMGMAMGMMPSMHPQMYAAHGGMPYHMAAGGYAYMPQMGGEQMAMAQTAAAYGMYGYAGYPAAMAPGYAMPPAAMPGAMYAAGGYDPSAAAAAAGYGHMGGEKHGYSHGGNKGKGGQGGGAAGPASSGMPLAGKGHAAGPGASS